MKKMPSPELLAPAGNLEKLKYALAYGADAVYAGVPRFSLRTRENEFREESLAEGIKYAHSLGKQVYLTLNIYAHNVKIDGFLKELDKMIQWNPDGLIMADPGLIYQARKRVGSIPIHLSTQANATNWTAVEFWRDMGVKRIILSRELRLKEIEEIHKRVPDVELEAFVHGAICIAYSGRCLITNYMNHRDANQGTCTNSCRWNYKVGEEDPSLLDHEAQENPSAPATPYVQPSENLYVEEPNRPGEHYPVGEDEHGTYLFNAKDLCSIELLDDMRKAGIISYKIEGRTKSEYYAAMSARSYRKAIDDVVAGKAFDPQNLKDLLALSNRGYTTGFYTRNPREFGENYHDSHSKERSHKAVGLHCTYDEKNGLLWFDIKNRLELGTDLEIITPNGLDIHRVTSMVDEKFQPKDTLHGGAGRGAFSFDKDPGEFAVLRRKLYDAEIAAL